MELVYSESRDRQEAVGLPDRELAIRARGGDMVSFETLVTRKTPAVVSLARRIVGNVEDARDVAQMVFLRVWNELHRYDEKYSLNTWLYRIATNLSIDFLRSSRSRERAHGATLHLVREREESTAADATRNAEDPSSPASSRRSRAACRRSRRRRSSCKEMEDCDTPRDRRDPGLRRVDGSQSPLQRPPDPPPGDRAALPGVPAGEVAAHERPLPDPPLELRGLRADALPAPQRRILREHLAACEECRELAAARDAALLFARPFPQEDLPAAEVERDPRQRAHGRRLRADGAADSPDVAPRGWRRSARGRGRRCRRRCVLVAPGTGARRPKPRVAARPTSARSGRRAASGRGPGLGRRPCRTSKAPSADATVYDWNPGAGREEPRVVWIVDRGLDI